MLRYMHFAFANFSFLSVLYNPKIKLISSEELLSNELFFIYLQIKPLVGPTKDIMKEQITTYQWHEFFPRGRQLFLMAFFIDKMVVLIYCCL
jgi:hypothetical protein